MTEVQKTNEFYRILALNGGNLIMMIEKLISGGT